MLNKCTSCGATIEYSAAIQSLKCPYCDAVNEIKKAEDVLPQNIEQIIPLSVTADDLEKRAYAHMATGDYTPDDMLEASTFTKRELFYVPAYLFKISYKATWTASFGYDREEPYTAYRTVTKNNQQRQEAYTAYKTVTDWRPQNGVDEGIFPYPAYAGSKLLESDLAVEDLVRFTVANGVSTKFNESFTKGVQTEGFFIPEASAFSAIMPDIEAEIEVKVMTHGQGDHQKDWHWNTQMTHETTTLYVPICYASFDYQGSDYHFWLDGLGKGEIRATELPEDETRKELVNLGFIPGVIASIGFIAAWYFWSFTWLGLISTTLVLAYGEIRRQAIVGYSKKIRESLLIQINASSTSMKDLSNEEQNKIAQSFQRPDKPFLAQTNKDKIVVPALALATLLSVFLSAYMENHSRSVQGEFGRIEETVVTVPASNTIVLTAPAEAPTEAPTEAPEANLNEQPSTTEAPTETPEAEAPMPKEKANNISFAPSFDCAKANTGPERLICSNSELAQLDVNLSQAYIKARDKSDDKKNLKSEQLIWMKTVRNACSDSDCLKNEMSKRILELTR